MATVLTQRGIWLLIAGVLVLAVLIAVSGVFEPIDTAPTRDPNLPP